MALKRNVTTFGLLMTSLSCMVGSGWLFGAYYASTMAGPAALLSWIIGGLLIIVIAFTFSELSTLFPIAGGIARYTQFSHGTALSFTMSWLAWLSCVAVAPTEVQAVLQYMAKFYPQWIQKAGAATVLSPEGYVIAAGLMLVITIINCIGIKRIILANNSMTIWKIAVPILVSLSLIYVHCDPSNFTQYGGFMPHGWHGVLSAMASVVVFSFLGFREATSLAGEAKNPSRAIPIAVIGSVSIGIVLYAIIQLAFTGAILPDMLSHGWPKLAFHHDAGPFAGIALSLGITWLAFLIFSDAIVSPMGTALIYTTTTSRLNYAMAKNHQLPAWMSKTNRFRVPAWAVIVNFVIGMVMLTPLPSWQSLIEYQTTAIVLAYSTGPASLIALREIGADLKRPFTLPFYRSWSYLTFFVCTLLAYWTGWPTIYRLMLSVIVGWVFYMAYRLLATEARHEPLQWRSAMWLIPYFGGLTLISYLGNFDGLGLITFGWDFVALAVLSAIGLYCAVQCRADRAHLDQWLADEKDHVFAADC